jgi:hypothetical protein
VVRGSVKKLMAGMEALEPEEEEADDGERTWRKRKTLEALESEEEEYTEENAPGPEEVEDAKEEEADEGEFTWTPAPGSNWQSQGNAAGKGEEKQAGSNMQSQGKARAPGHTSTSKIMKLGIVVESCAHPHIAIANFDEFTSTRWFLQQRHLDFVRVVKDMREFLFSHELYLAAMTDDHPGLMADIAGRLFCDYYELHGSAGFFTGNNVGRYIADILNPYHLMSEQYKQTFIQNGMQHRSKY